MRREFVTVAVLALVVGLIGSSAGCGGGSEPARSADAPSTSAPTAAKDSGKTASTSSPWGSFKVGSYVKTKTTVSTQVMGHSMDTSTESKTTLAELTLDKAVLDIETTIAGTTTKTRSEVPLTAGVMPTASVSGGGPVPEVKTGTDSVTVGGKSLDCKTFETDTEAAGSKVNTKIWTSDQVPGAMVKTVSTTSGATTSKTTVEVTDFKAS